MLGTVVHTGVPGGRFYVASILPQFNKEKAKALEGAGGPGDRTHVVGAELP